MDGQNRDQSFRSRICIEVDLKLVIPQHIKVNRYQYQVSLKDYLICSRKLFWVIPPRCTYRRLARLPNDHYASSNVDNTIPRNLSSASSNQNKQSQNNHNLTNSPLSPELQSSHLLKEQIIPNILKLNSLKTSGSMASLPPTPAHLGLKLPPNIFGVKTDSHTNLNPSHYGYLFSNTPLFPFSFSSPNTIKSINSL